MRTATVRWRRRFAQLAALIGASALVLPTAAAHAQEDGQPSQLVIAIDQSDVGFNPFARYFITDYEIANLNYDSLMSWSPKDYAPAKRLATSWKESEDGLTWTFEIRDDAVFSDGEPLTAEDVEFTYQRLMNDPAARAGAEDLVQDFESVQATDDTTVVFELEKPTTLMLALDHPIVPKHVWEKYKDVGDVTKVPNDDFPVVGSGPFKTVEFKRDQFIRFEAKEKHWDGVPKYDEVILRYYKQADAAVQALIAGEADIVSGLTPAQYTALEKETGIKVNAAQGRRTASVTFNVGAQARNGDKIGDGHPALQDSKLRQALHHALNRDQLLETVYDGKATEGVSYVPRIFDTFFWEPQGEEKVAFDIDEANRILDDAGYDKRNEDGIRIDPKSKRPLDFRLLHHADDTAYTNVAQFLEEWWEQLDIGIEVESKDSGKLNDDLYAGKYDIIFSGWSGGPDPSSLLSLYTCGALPQTADSDERDTDTFYCNPEYDKLYDEQKRETDEAKRVELVHEMQRILYNDAPMITFAYADVLEAYRSNEWTDIVTQPAERGMIRGQLGRWAVESATPVEGEEAQSNTGVLLGAGAVAVIAVAAVGVFLLRRRSTVEDRE